MSTTRRQSSRGQSTEGIPNYVSPLIIVAVFFAPIVIVVRLWDALVALGLSQNWAFVAAHGLVLLLVIGTFYAWKAVRRRRRVAKHKQWVSNLGNDFHRRLEEARREAQAQRKP